MPIVISPKSQTRCLRNIISVARTIGSYISSVEIPALRSVTWLAILKITKQSLSRVLGQLVREGFIEQKTGLQDRRQRLLTLTEKGEALERELTKQQRALIAEAYREAGAESVEGFRKVMLGMMEEKDRQRFEDDGATGQRRRIG